MTTKYGQMATARVIGPMSGMTTVTGRRPLPLAQMPEPSAVYWPSQPVGIARTPSRTAAPSGPAPAQDNGGPCCGQ